MDLSKHLSPTPTDLIDWMNAEGILDLDWDSPEDGGYEKPDWTPRWRRICPPRLREHGVEVTPEELIEAKALTPTAWCALIASKAS